MPDEELVSVYTVQQPNRAEVIRLALESEGIACTLGGENQGGLTGLFEIDILVRESDVARARQLIQEHEVSENQSADDLTEDTTE